MMRAPCNAVRTSLSCCAQSQHPEMPVKRPGLLDSATMRAYGLAKATWKHRDGFIAYVCSCALSDNVMRMVRLVYG